MVKLGMKQGLESQTRAQTQGELTNNFHVSDRLWNILQVPMRGIGGNEIAGFGGLNLFFLLILSELTN
jgi:hypothetical protein